jgi:hypothetical protein
MKDVHPTHDFLSAVSFIDYSFTVLPGSLVVRG